MEWDIWAERFGLVTVSRRLLKRLFDRLDDKEARELGKHSGESAGPEMITFWFKTLNLENTLKVFEMLGSQYAGNFRFEHHVEGNNHVLILKHDSGVRTSAYYSEAVKGMFGRLGIRAECEETEDQVVARIPA